jgi:hypothetical protein
MSVVTNPQGKPNGTLRNGPADGHNRTIATWHCVNVSQAVHQANVWSLPRSGRTDAKVGRALDPAQNGSSAMPWPSVNTGRS